MAGIKDELETHIVRIKAANTMLDSFGSYSQEKRNMSESFKATVGQLFMTLSVKIQKTKAPIYISFSQYGTPSYASEKTNKSTSAIQLYMRENHDDSFMHFSC